MPDSPSSELVQLAHELSVHPSCSILWQEGSCALKLSEQRYLVSPRAGQLGSFAENQAVKLDLPAMENLSKAEAISDDQLAEALVNAEGKSPTLDALLYAYLLSLEGVRIAAHLHPVEINQILCSPRARQFADRRMLPDEIIGCGAAALLASYADPGLALAKEVRRRMVLWKDRFKTVPKVVLVQNHGMFVLGENARELVRTTEMMIKAAKVFIGAAAMGGPVFLTPNNVSQIEALKVL
jgi:rhamnose utilization protein RhaD (predicted bifunctional aldolase and dehydrogenase)